MKPLVNREEVPFSRTQLDLIINGISEEYRLWNCFFGHNGIVPIMANYELFVGDPEKYVPLLANQLGITELNAVRKRPQLERQRDEMNARWRSLYLGDKG
jgi:LPS sulfotransferase NodH